MPKPKPSPENLRGSLVLYALYSLLAFYPCFFLGQAYFDNDLLAQFGPWRSFLRDQLFQGHFPLWNPYNLGGQPFFADLQNMMLYPLNDLTLPFSVPTGLSLFFFLHMFLAAWGMHLWLRAMGLSEKSCRVGALLFASSNFFWLELIHPPVLAAFAWLPWLFLCLGRLAKESTPLNAFTSGFCFAMLFLCGSFQVTLGALYGGIAYYLFRWFTERKKTKASFPPKSFLIPCFFLVWGAFPLLGQLIPTLEFSSLSDRHNPNSQAEAMKAQTSLSPLSLVQFFFPRAGLQPGQDMAEALQFGEKEKTFSLAGNWGYLGVWAPFLFFMAFRHGEKRMVWFWGSFGLLALLLALGLHTPLYGLFNSALPGFSLIRVPYRYLYLYVLAASMLAALGFEAWAAKKTSKGESHLHLKWPLVFTLLFYLAALLKPSLNWREIVALVLGTLAFFCSSGLRPSFQKWAPALLGAAVILPLLLNGWNDFTPGPASNFNFAKNSNSLVEAAKQVDPYRLIFFNSEMNYPIQVHGRSYVLAFPQNAACALGIKNFGGYNPLVLQSKKDIGALPLKPLLQLGAIGGILTQIDHGPIPGFQLESFPPYLLYRRQETSALAYAPGDLFVEPDPAQVLMALQKPDFDASRTGYLSPIGPNLPAGEQKNFPPANFLCRLDKETTDGQTYSVTLDKANLVVFCEVMYPGWKAWVDGKPSSLYTADYFLRAVEVPAGNHEVEFRFEPYWWAPIKLGWALWCALTFWGLIRWRNREAPFA